MWTPNNKTIITLEPIEIPFSFMLRCWSIWRGILTWKNRDHRFGWGAGAQGQRAPQTITFWITISEWFYFPRFERSRFYEHFDTKIIQIGPLQPVIWSLEDCGSTGGAQIWGGGIKWAPRSENWHCFTVDTNTCTKKEWNLRRCVKISLKNVYTWHGTPQKASLSSLFVRVLCMATSFKFQTPISGYKYKFVWRVTKAM